MCPSRLILLRSNKSTLFQIVDLIRSTFPLFNRVQLLKRDVVWLG
jgi:hypothetical protein